jgi:MobA/MobL family
MAHNYFKPSVIKRSAGKNAIGAAAYINRAKYVDERTGKVWDFTKLGGLEFSGIFAPKDAPAFAKKANDLWQEVENREDKSPHRDTAQVARSFIIPLPHELSKRDRQWLVTDFARELSRKGMVVHVAIHEPEEEKDQRNYHVHVLVTMRELTEDGFGNKVREWNDRDEYKRWNERWSQLGARYLRKAGFEQEADRFEVGHLPRSQQQREAEKRGDTEWAEKKSQEPEKHRGPAVRGMDDREIKTEVDRQNEEIRDRNRHHRREAKRDLLGEIREHYEDSATPQEFVRKMKDRGLHVARVNQEDLDLSWKDFSAPHGELEKMKKMQEKGAWTLQNGGSKKLVGDQLDRAEKAYGKYKADPAHKMSFYRYVEFVQKANEVRMRDLANHVRNIDFADDGLPARKPEYRAQAGDYVVLNRNGFVYRLDERTTGEKPAEVTKFMSGLNKDKTILSVTETRGMLEATRVADRLDKAAKRLESASKPSIDRGLDLHRAEYGRAARKTLRIMSGALDSVTDLFSSLFAAPETPKSRAEAEHARLLREENEERAREREGRSRDR